MTARPASSVLFVLAFTVGLGGMYLLGKATSGQRDTDGPATQQEARRLDAAVESLHADVRAMQRVLEPFATRPVGLSQENPPPASTAHLEDRIMALEASLARLEDSLGHPAQARNAEQPASGGKFVDGAASGQLFNAGASDAYELGEGEPLGDHVDHLSRVLHAASGDMNLHSMDCRETACRVIYSPPESDHGEFDIADVLRKDLPPGTQLRIRYDRDDYGNEVAYVQVQQVQLRSRAGR